MKKVRIQHPAGLKYDELSVFTNQDEANKLWVVTINCIEGRCVAGRSQVESDAFKCALTKLYDGVVGFVPESYPWDEAWESYYSSADWPSQPIISIPV